MKNEQDVFAIIHINRKTKVETPRLNLAPMNHAAACNWMNACRNEYSDYRITPWPDGVKKLKPTMIANEYR